MDGVTSRPFVSFTSHSRTPLRPHAVVLATDVAAAAGGTEAVQTPRPSRPRRQGRPDLGQEIDVGTDSGQES